MYYDKTTPWERLPKYLHFDELQDPVLVIHDFFSSGELKDHRKDLKKWLFYVVNEQCYVDKRHGAGSLIFVYDLNLKLIEALFLLSDVYSGKQGKGTMSAEVLEQAKQQGITFPKNLSRKELLSPCKAINKCFRKMDIQQYRSSLHEWLRVALYYRAADESLPAGEILTVYHNLLRLYSAAWLIYQRDDKVLALDTTKNGSGSVSDQREKVYLIRDINPSPTTAEKLGLDEIKKIMLRLFPTVQLISYLGSHSDPFTFYLLVLIADDEKIPEHEISNKLEDNCRYLANVLTIVHKANSARTGVANGQRFWNKVLANGFLLYRADELDLPEPVVVDRSALLERARFHWDRWGEQGKIFLEGAELYRAAGNNRLAAFMLHQCVESILKALIQAILGYRVQMHNLSRLLRLSLLFTDDLKQVFGLESVEGQQLFTLLQASYSQSRYNAKFDPDAESVGLLAERVGTFCKAGEELLQQYMTGLDSHR